MGEPSPAVAVVRVSRATFDPDRFAEVDAMNKKTSQYLIPAIERLPGLIHFYAGVSPGGSVVQVSVWDSDEHASQLDHLTEMTVTARGEAEAAGVAFTPIVNYPIGWTIRSGMATGDVMGPVPAGPVMARRRCWRSTDDNRGAGFSQRVSSEDADLERRLVGLSSSMPSSGRSQLRMGSRSSAATTRITDTNRFAIGASVPVSNKCRDPRRSERRWPLAP